MLELNNLDKVYKLKKKNVHAVKKVNLTFNRGEFVSILGLSGSGKTTLVSLIGGLEEPSNGQLRIDGIDTTSFNKKQWTDYRKNTIGFVFQDFNLIDHLTAIDNIKIALSLSGRTEEEKEMRAVELLEMVGMIDQRNKFPRQMSGGQQQRIAIARALSNNPEIILADEPTGALDPDTSVQIMELLQELAAKDHLVIMVTHDKYLAKDYSSRIVNIKDGSITSDTQLKDVKKMKFPPVKLEKSSLEISAALRVSLNNLKIRKKSSYFAIGSLIPSIILVIILGNFIMNLIGYQHDIEPIYNNITNSEEIHFLSNMTEKEFEWDLKNLLTSISKKRHKEEKVAAMESALYQPFNETQIKEIKSIPGIIEVIEPNLFDITIEGEHFILVGLLPETYKSYQYDFNFNYYPNNDDQGLIMSVDAANVLLGKYNTSPESIEGDDIQFTVDSYNSLPLHIKSEYDNSNLFETSILKIFDPKTKTTLMSNYYKGYIYASAGYIETIKNAFDLEDISLVSYEVIGEINPNASENKYIPIGAKNLTDLLVPLRSKTMLQEDMEMFTIKQYSPEVPSSNYMTKYKIISDGPLSKKSIKQLSTYGNYNTSQYAKHAIFSANETNEYISNLLLYSKITVAIIVALPSILVALILYISIILRTKEIGVLKSIGAKSKDIVAIFTFESGLLAVTSGLVAIILAFPVLNFVREKLEAEYHLTFYLGSNPLDANYFAIFGSLFTIVSLITLLGILPGIKASKLHPRVLLRRIG